jgi:hypothetical protein
MDSREFGCMLYITWGEHPSPIVALSTLLVVHVDVSQSYSATLPVFQVASPTPYPQTARTLSLEPLTHPSRSPVSVNARLLISAAPVHAFVGKISLASAGEGVFRFIAGVVGGERL